MLTGYGFVILLLQSLTSSILNATFYTWPLFTFYVIVVSTGINSIIYCFDNLISRIFGFVVYIFLIYTLATYVILRLLQLFGRRFILFGQNLLLSCSNSNDGQLSIDQGACLAIVFFL